MFFSCNFNTKSTIANACNGIDMRDLNGQINFIEKNCHRVYGCYGEFSQDNISDPDTIGWYSIDGKVVKYKEIFVGEFSSYIIDCYFLSNYILYAKSKQVFYILDTNGQVLNVSGNKSKRLTDVYYDGVNFCVAYVDASLTRQDTLQELSEMRSILQKMSKVDRDRLRNQ